MSSFGKGICIMRPERQGSSRLFLLLTGVACLLSASPLMSQSPTITHVVEVTLGQAFYLCPRHPWVKTSLTLDKGATYQIIAEASPDYRDAIVPADADGVRGLGGKLFDLSARRARWWNPFTWSSRLGVSKQLRVLRDGTSERRRATFLTLIASIGPEDRPENTIVVGRGRAFVAPEQGTLYLFANDWPGGEGTAGDARYVRTKKDGSRVMPTYGNNQGHLTVTITRLHHPEQPR
jgi:hypothetical protein